MSADAAAVAGRADVEDPAVPRAIRLCIGGRVQGVGFRPHVYRLALRHGLEGSVRNRGSGVEIEVGGPAAAIEAFTTALLREAPPLAQPRLESAEAIARPAGPGFRIAPSVALGDTEARLPPDRTLCADCARELADPADRRWRHPFINCTQCGPRYTVIRNLPYDRAATSLAGFALCPACAREYADPLDRRFHAEPLSCPGCGPRLRFVAAGRAVEGDEAALRAAVAALRAGAIVAVKGIGGYHLLCDARDAGAVQRLRQRKRRPAKPLAVMFPHAGVDGLDALRAELAPGPAEAAALLDPACPIVLVGRRPDSRLPDVLAPGLGELGALLPYSPLHRLLLADFGAPLVATSGNLSGEPVLTDPTEAAARLSGVADAFLHHDRPIVRPADDAVVRVIAGVPRPLRHGRGDAPLELALGQRVDEPLLAVGGESKLTIALAFADRLVLGPHLGSLQSPRGTAVFAQVAADLQQLYGVRARRLVVDSHPGYRSTRWARAQGLPLQPVWHHHAHASALAWEEPAVARWLVLAWDGVGLGEDGTLWGGEALLGAPGGWRWVGSWRPFRPPGGDRAAREPWRSAAALRWANEPDPARAGDIPGAPADIALAHAAWRQGLNAPATSAVGRLFDAAACLLLGIAGTSYEAEAPMRLEALAHAAAGEALPLPLADDEAGVLRIDWAPLLGRLDDAARPPAARAADFHATLAAAAAAQAGALHRRHGFDAVGLCGGVFQNRRLVDELLPRLEAMGLRACLPRRIAVNDAGLALGQAVEAAAARRRPG